MTENDDNEFTFTRVTSDLLDEKRKDNSSTVRSSAAIDVIAIDELIVNVHLKYAYSELEAFADELAKINK